jgi:cation transport ATPase
VSVRELRFDVEQAGCESCAELVRSALEPLLDVREVSIDARTDLATVVAEASHVVTVDAVDEALAAVSEGSGHHYRVVPGSLT